MSTFMGRRWGWLDRLLVCVVVLVIATLTATLAATVIDSITARRDSNQQLTESRDRATRRIDLLTEQIQGLQQRLDEQSIEVGQARTRIALLEQQIRQLGGQPVTRRTP